MLLRGALLMYFEHCHFALCCFVESTGMPKTVTELLGLVAARCSDRVSKLISVPSFLRH